MSVKCQACDEDADIAVVVFVVVVSDRVPQLGVVGADFQSDEVACCLKHAMQAVSAVSFDDTSSDEGPN